MRRLTIFILLMFLWLMPVHAQAVASNQAHLQELLAASSASYAQVKDYSSFFYKEERSEKGIDPKEKIYLKFEKPFKIFMKWLEPDRKGGVQVMYERGQHNNKLVVHKPGLLLGLAPIIFLDQNSPYVKEGSASYNIEDAGIGAFLTDLSEDVEKASKDGKLKAEFPEATDQGQSVDIVFEGSSKQSGFMAYRVVVFFDRATNLPIRMQLFDWNGNVTGTYAYEDLKLNTGSTDPEFKKESHRKLFKLYNHIE